MSAPQRWRVGVVGASGYVGAGLLRRLALHPHVDLVAATSRQHDGRRVAEVYPQLEGVVGLRFEDRPALDVAQGCDALFLALPHGVSAGVVADLFDGDAPRADARIIDMSGDFRLDDPATYARHYGKPHPCPQHLGRFVYGLSEWARESVAASRWVANPGCFATAIGLGLAPLAAAGLLPPRVTVVAATGSTGSGAAPGPGTHHPERAHNVRLYKVLDHQHTPEITGMLARLGAPHARLSFIPMSAPMRLGIYAVLHVACEAPAAAAAAIRDAYEGAPFVRVRQGAPQLAWVLHSNFADIGLTVGDGELVVAVAIDNLVKGAAGQGIHNLNLMLGCDERAGLSDAPAIP